MLDLCLFCALQRYIYFAVIELDIVVNAFI